MCPAEERFSTDGLAQLVERVHRIAVAPQFEPDFVLYQAGVDGHADDRLGRLALSDEGLERRDRYVIDAVRSRGIALTSALGGGYGSDPRVVGARHARSMISCARTNAQYGRSAFARQADAIGQV